MTRLTDKEMGKVMEMTEDMVLPIGTGKDSKGWYRICVMKRYSK